MRPPSGAYGSGSRTRNMVAPAQRRWRFRRLCFACCFACFAAVVSAGADGLCASEALPLRAGLMWCVRSDCVGLAVRRVERRRERWAVRVVTGLLSVRNGKWMVVGVDVGWW